MLVLPSPISRSVKWLFDASSAFEVHAPAKDFPASPVAGAKRTCRSVRGMSAFGVGRTSKRTDFRAHFGPRHPDGASLALRRRTPSNKPVVLRSCVAIADEVTARRLERYFKSGSGKAFAKKRFPGAPE